MKALIIISGIITFLIGALWKFRLKKYAFDNRTSGGGSEFKNYSHYNLHLLGRALSSLMLIGGIIICFYGYGYNPYEKFYPSNWNSMSEQEQRTWKYFHDSPEKLTKWKEENMINPYELLKNKEFSDWTKQMEIETNISHLVWRDLADNTAKNISFPEQEKLMKKWHFNRDMVKAVKSEYEFDPNDPLDVWRAEQKKREEERKKSEK
ncbi:hypothetical protein [Flavivirga sp. 57AJ16]|uniref:hypothetical protein n=1 Tax=Flavivirga sp. 57AJ16 TaxID=3025307 RepID=UPI0023651E1E|nr:hypothetical protein [Flavivirga sp. 57AJ16]MDD7886006.1 hypothetical protein [Flavivirga sp. 57AJ16]